MTNQTVLPLLALLLAVLSAFVPLQRGSPTDSSRDRFEPFRLGGLLAAIFVVGYTVASQVWPQTLSYGTATSLALSLGVLVGVLASAVSWGMRGFSLGLAVAGASALHFGWIGAEALAMSQLAYVVGASIGAFAVSGPKSGTEGGFLAAISTLFVVGLDFLGRAGQAAPSGTEAAGWTGIVLGLCLSASCLISGIAGRYSKSLTVTQGLGFLAFALTGYFACSRYLDSAMLANLWVMGVAVAGIVHLIFLGDSEAESFRLILSTVIWLGAATVAFGFDQGYGMAVTLLGGAGVLVLLGSTKGLMSMAITAAILVYRLFRELFPSEARAMDIGQHYTMIGIALGALLPLLPLEWSRKYALTRGRAAIATGLWLCVLLGLPIAASILLGSKGAIGLVVGMAFAVVVEGLRGAASLAPVAIASGVGALTVLSFNWLGDWSDLERGAKVRAVLIVGGVALLLGLSLLALTRTRSQKVAANP